MLVNETLPDILVIIVIQNYTLASTEVHLEGFLSPPSEKNLTVLTSDGGHKKPQKKFFSEGVLHIFDKF